MPFPRCLVAAGVLRAGSCWWLTGGIGKNISKQSGKAKATTDAGVGTAARRVFAAAKRREHWVGKGNGIGATKAMWWAARRYTTVDLWAEHGLPLNLRAEVLDEDLAAVLDAHSAQLHVALECSIGACHGELLPALPGIWEVYGRTRALEGVFLPGSATVKEPWLKLRGDLILVRHAIQRTDTPRDSLFASYQNDSSHRLGLLVQGEDGATSDQHDRGLVSAGAQEVPKRSSRRMLLGLAALGALIVVVLVVVLPVCFTVIKKHNSSASSSGGGGGATGAGGGGRSPSSSPSSKAAITGGDGSSITMDDGSNFTYSNAFGGSWYYDHEDPFNNNAQVNSWTPPLNISWNFSTDQIRGVNIGSLFVLEPFISSALFQAYPDAIDEWSLSEAIAANTSTTLQAVLEAHYSKGGLELDTRADSVLGHRNLGGHELEVHRAPPRVGKEIRFEGQSGSAYYSGVAEWVSFFLLWAFHRPRHLDDTDDGLVAAFNYSGKFGVVNFLNGVVGMASAQRALNYIRIITEFIGEPEWTDVVPIFGVVNEALLNTIGREQLNSFYLETHNMIRNTTGVGVGKGPHMSVHDGFQGVATWARFMPGSDRVILDSHPGSSEATIASGTNPASAGGTWPKTACTKWGNGFNASRSSFGVTITGDMSAGFNDCGLFLRGVNFPPTTTNCGARQDSSNWLAAARAEVMQFTLASMDALQDYFFWTGKIGNSDPHRPARRRWQMRLPRRLRHRLRLDLPPLADRGVDAGTIFATWSSSYSVYPPATISNAGATASALPQYTSTGTVATLVPPPTLTAGGVTAIAGCKYPNAWSAMTRRLVRRLLRLLRPAQGSQGVGLGGDAVGWSIGGATRRNNLQAQGDLRYLF
ncbi:glycoside hydrolase family 5 protein [Athelia psychrophila]|uniref:glucan 1,3-beta-glucosidase n=1 Tax=Athelia psychrophila TaxID=1759441 RepID=A0A165XYM7_9AGAM|nr:glycoside hydrolase family 5 protein [Fibularhizoctonia sp. CBS 109695]